MNRITEQQAINVLNFIGLMTVADYLCETFKDTNFYRHGVRHHAKQLQKQLEPIIERDLQNLFDKDTTNTAAFTEQCLFIAERIFTLQPEKWQLINLLLEAFDSNQIWAAKLKAVLIEFEQQTCQNLKINEK